ncbi:MAG: OmpA family protein [Pseudomonadota bacterium]|nr:OmpA family protein [Pseudomonadota bacterium]
MFKHLKTLRALGRAAPVALTFALMASSAHAIEEESYWYALGDPSVPDGQLWTTSYGECWQSAYPDGPTNLPPCVSVPEEFTLRLNFEFDKYRMENVVNRDEVARLDEYIADVKATPADEYLTVVGHTDAKGSYEYNEALGMRRADTVRDYMIQEGLSADRIAPAESRGKTDMLPEYDQFALEQRRSVIHSTTDQ